LSLWLGRYTHFLRCFSECVPITDRLFRSGPLPAALHQAYFNPLLETWDNALIGFLGEHNSA